jgi:[ribosomal protein S5]-alanine N-acetyltransferase
MLNDANRAAFDALPAVVTTERLTLRYLTPADITPSYLSWFQDEEVIRFLEVRDLNRQRAIDHLEAGAQEHEYRVYAICWTATGEHVGNIKLGSINWFHGYSDLVTVIGDRSAWGKGVAREAIAASIRLAFGPLDLRKVSASIYSNNVRSIRAYTEGGCVVEAHLRGQLLSDGKPVDRVMIGCFNPKFFPGARERSSS